MYNFLNAIFILTVFFHISAARTKSNVRTSTNKAWTSFTATAGRAQIRSYTYYFEKASPCTPASAGQWTGGDYCTISLPKSSAGTIQTVNEPTSYNAVCFQNQTSLNYYIKLSLTTEYCCDGYVCVDTTTTGFPWWYIIAVLLIIAVVASLIYLRCRKRQQASMMVMAIPARQMPVRGYPQPYDQPMGPGYGVPMQGYPQPMQGYPQPMQGYPQPMNGYPQQPMQMNPQQITPGYGQPMQGYSQQPMPAGQPNRPSQQTFGVSEHNPEQAAANPTPPNPPASGDV